MTPGTGSLTKYNDRKQLTNFLAGTGESNYLSEYSS